MGTLSHSFHDHRRPLLCVVVIIPLTHKTVFLILPSQKKNSEIFFQDAALFDSITVEENVGFPCSMHTDSTKEEIGRYVAVILKSSFSRYEVII